MLFKALLNMGASPKIYIKEGYQSGQMGRAVNPLTSVFEGSDPSPPPFNNFFNNMECTWVLRV